MTPVIMMVGDFAEGGHYWARKLVGTQRTAMMDDSQTPPVYYDYPGFFSDLPPSDPLELATWVQPSFTPDQTRTLACRQVLAQLDPVTGEEL